MCTLVIGNVITSIFMALAVGAGGQSVITFNPAHQKPLAYRDATVTAELVLGTTPYRLRVSSGNRKADVDLPLDLAQVDEIRPLASNKLGVRGMVNGAGAEVVLIDMNSLTVIDHILGYLPSFSPDGNWIAFVKFYPTHFVDQPDDHFSLYAVADSPGKNRPAADELKDAIDVGYVYYPPGVGNRPFDNLGNAGNQQHGVNSTGFFWNPESDKLFVSVWEGRPDNVAGLVVKIADAHHVEITKFPLSSEELCGSPSKEGDLTCSGVLNNAVFSENQQSIAFSFRAQNGVSRQVTLRLR